MKRPARLVAAFGLALALLIVGPADVSAAGYRDYAERMVRSMPAGVSARPDLEEYIAGLLNGYRKAQGKAPVKASDAATVAARAQALDMLKGNFVGHESASGYRFKQRAEAFLGETESVGENAARDRQPGAADKAKAQRLFRQWIDSRGHRRNLVSNDYAEVSTGVIQAGNHLYAVQIFWKKRETEGGLSAFRSW